jgi:hypothetical protein
LYLLLPWHAGNPHGHACPKKTKGAEAIGTPRPFAYPVDSAACCLTVINAKKSSSHATYGVVPSTHRNGAKCGCRRRAAR